MKTRNYGLDLLRVLSMMGIVGLHVLGSGGILQALSISSINYYIANFFEILFYSSVNIFAILTGYLYYRKETNIKNLLNLLVTVLFYSILITIIFSIFFPEYMTSLGQYIFGVFPMLIGRYWYIVSYVFVFLMIPYFNILIKSINMKKYQNMLIIQFVLFSILTVFLQVDFFKIESGYSPIWLSYCYFIGAFLKKKNSINLSKKKNMIIIFLNIILLELIILFFQIFIEDSVNLCIDFFLLKYNSPFILVNSILIFMLFKDKKIENNINKMILLKASKVSFGVYIIHSHYLIFNHLFTNYFQSIAELGCFAFLFTLLFIIIIIYVSCGFIELCRMKVFENIFSKMLKKFIQ